MSAKVEPLKAQAMYAINMLLTSLDPEKIAKHVDQKDECSFVFFNLGTAKNCCKIRDDTKFGYCFKWRLF